MSNSRSRCGECGKRRVLGADQLCKECSAIFYDGALCCRCDLSLDEWGYCPNDRCPFSDHHQDEGRGYDPIETEEVDYVRNVVIPRQARKRKPPGDRP